LVKQAKRQREAREYIGAEWGWIMRRVEVQRYMDRIYTILLDVMIVTFVFMQAA
jgi:hypothetical protein